MPERTMNPAAQNLDPYAVKQFGPEWERFTQTEMDDEVRDRIFASYFSLFPWDRLPPGGGVGADIGCGSGRWARLVAPRVERLHLVDPSSALEVARRNCAEFPNVEYHSASVAAVPLPDASLDFVYTLGVLHHLPDMQAALRSIHAKLKPGAPLLAYVYYALDGRPAWFRALWRVSNVARWGISRSPWWLRTAASEVVAATVYLPLATAARVLERMGRLPAGWPLSEYRDKGYYVMRTDALNRFGVRVERRYSREQIQEMMERAGFVDVRFCDEAPFWRVLAYRGG
jgi:SAM-dependent methyltransferase